MEWVPNKNRTTRDLDNNNLTRFPLECLLDYQYFKEHYQLIAVGLSKQKELDADWRAIQQTEFYGMLKTSSQVCTILEKSKETMLEFYKGAAKVLWII